VTLSPLCQLALSPRSLKASTWYGWSRALVQPFWSWLFDSRDLHLIVDRGDIAVQLLSVLTCVIILIVLEFFVVFSVR
jgi:hypothetical protein